MKRELLLALDAYQTHVRSDNNGGAIVTFWTVRGRISAQHTGRVGKVGIITKMLEHEPIARDSELSQSSPKPFNSSTQLRYLLADRLFTEMILFDALAREVKNRLGVKQKGSQTDGESNGHNQNHQTSLAPRSC